MQAADEIYKPVVLKHDPYVDSDSESNKVSTDYSIAFKRVNYKEDIKSVGDKSAPLLGTFSPRFRKAVSRPQSSSHHKTGLRFGTL